MFVVSELDNFPARKTLWANVRVQEKDCNYNHGRKQTHWKQINQTKSTHFGNTYEICNISQLTENKICDFAN